LTHNFRDPFNRVLIVQQLLFLLLLPFTGYCSIWLELIGDDLPAYPDFRLQKNQPRGLACLACCVGRRKPKLHQDRLTLLFVSVQEMGQFGSTKNSLTIIVKFCKFFLQFWEKGSENY